MKYDETKEKILSKVLLMVTCLMHVMLPVKADGDGRLFARLDSLLAIQPRLTKAKEHHIMMLRERLMVPQLTPRQEYAVNETLFQEYMAFKYDSAYHYVLRNIALAEHNGFWREYNLSTLNMVHILSVMGLFDEAEKYINKVRMEYLTRDDSLIYYNSYSDVHLYMAEFCEGTVFHDSNIREAQRCRSVALSLAKPSTMIGITTLSNYKLYTGHYQQAIALLERYLAKGVKSGTRDFSIVTSDLAYYYACKKDAPMRRRYLLLSAISDVQGSIRENNSLRELASLLFDEGDYDRAYKYINAAIGDANYYGTRLRNNQAAMLMPKIIDGYHKAQQHNRQVLTVMAFISFIITLLLIIALIFIVIYLRRYNRTNRMVKVVNKRLNNTVEQLEQKNLQLKESGQIREQYIGRFMELASMLISRGEDRRKQAYRMVKEHRLDELFTNLKSPLTNTEDAHIFYTNFDQAFLNIFPHFVADVNALMQPQKQFVIKDNALNTELRILALLRLGISDNQRIAAILRSSITTIYTYRSKLKASSLWKEDFENRIGSI